MTIPDNAYLLSTEERKMLRSISQSLRSQINRAERKKQDTTMLELQLKHVKSELAADRNGGPRKRS